MPLFKFTYIAVNGTKETVIQADSIKIVCPDGSDLELHGRTTDGEVALYASDRLVLRPVAGNCARVASEK